MAQQLEEDKGVANKDMLSQEFLLSNHQAVKKLTQGY